MNLVPPGHSITSTCFYQFQAYSKAIIRIHFILFITNHSHIIKPSSRCDANLMLLRKRTHSLQYFPRFGLNQKPSRTENNYFPTAALLDAATHLRTVTSDARPVCRTVSSGIFKVDLKSADSLTNELWMAAQNATEDDRWIDVEAHRLDRQTPSPGDSRGSDIVLQQLTNRPESSVQPRDDTNDGGERNNRDEQISSSFPFTGIFFCVCVHVCSFSLCFASRHVAPG